MSNSQVSNFSDVKYKALAEDQIDKVQSRLLPLLDNHECLHRLKKVIEKYETLNAAEIERILHSKINKFRPITQHKIRDFINRRDKVKSSNNSDKAFSYQSDNSNFVSPSSRESHSSRSDSDNNINRGSLQSEVLRLWPYTICQKEICQLLHDNGDLEVCSPRSVAIDFQQLKPSSLRALNDYIYEKSVVIEKIQNDEELKMLFQIMSHKTFDDQTVSEIYDIIHRHENIPPNPSGLRSIQITSLKPETKRNLVKLLKPKRLNVSTNSSNVMSSSSTMPINKTSSSSHVVSPKNVQAKGQLEDLKSVNCEKVVDSDRTQYGPFSKEELRFLLSCINEAIKDKRCVDVVKIISDHEEAGNSPTLNLKKLKDETKHYLWKYFTKTDDPMTNC